MQNFGPVNTLAINTTKRTTAQTDYSRFVDDDNQRAIFFMDLPFRSRTEVDPLTTGPKTVNTIPVNVIPNTDNLIPNTEDLFFSSKNWVGRPDDPIRPNRAPRRRLVAAFRVRRTTPYFPDEQSRIQVAIANATLQNDDRWLDFLAFEKTSEGFRAPIWHGPLDGPFSFAQRLIQPKVAGIETTGDELVIQFSSETSKFASLPLQRARYDGTGGINGDPELAGSLRPLVFGSVFNMEPTPMFRAALIYQVNSGPTAGIGPVWDGGSEVPFDRDFPNLESLAAATIAPGHYATCRSLGLFRMQLAPLHRLTCSVRGDAPGGVYLLDAGSVLFHVLTVIAGQPTSLLNVTSFFQLSKQEIGWYNERRDYTIEDFVNILLRPENAVLGETTTGLIGVIRHRPPSLQSATKTLRVRPSQVEARRTGFTPLKAQTVLYGRNWTVMGDGDFAAGVGAVSQEPFRRQWFEERATSGLVSAFSNLDSQETRKETWWTGAQQAEARRQAAEDVTMFGRSTIALTVRGLGRRGFSIRDGEVVNLVTDKFGFNDGRNVVVTGIDLGARNEQVDLEVVA